MVVIPKDEPVMDAATAELVAVIRAILRSDMPTEILVAAVLEQHKSMSNEEYEQVWPHLDSKERAKWKYYSGTVT